MTFQEHKCDEAKPLLAKANLSFEFWDGFPIQDDERGMWSFGTMFHEVPIVFCPFCGKRL